MAVVCCAAAATLPVNTQTATSAGATFIAPAGWAPAMRAWGIVLQSPDPDTRIAIVDIPTAANATAAARAAWALYKPDFNRKLQLATPLAAGNGWDESWDDAYEAAPPAAVNAEAIVHRAATHWTVALIEGSDATIEKRRSALRLILQSLHPRGFQRESFAGRTARTLDAARIAALLSFVHDSMRTLGIPGAAVSLIDHGRVVYEGGLGVRELGKPALVDAHTLFMIASNTKGMTTLLLAKLVDRKKLRWDEAVTGAYAGFRLGDAATTRKVLVKHLVCACTGLPRQDLEWFFKDSATTPAAATFTALSGMRPTTEFGTTYQYSNLMAAAAGYVAANVIDANGDLGATYDHAMRDMIFRPLGMDDTTFDFAAALSGDHASPHGTTIDGAVAVADENLNTPIISLRPAGGAWSSAHDMARYDLDELELGRLPDGTQLVSPPNMLARRLPGVSMGADETYGMGLRNDNSYGIDIIHHGGSLAGYNSDFFAIPSAGIGAVILTNADGGGALMRPFLRRLLEILYDGKPEAAAGVTQAAAASAARQQAARDSLIIPPGAAAAGMLAPRYTNEALGHINVQRGPGGVVFDFGAWQSHVGARENADGTVSFVTIDPAAAGKDFVATRTGHKRALVIHDGQHEYVYGGD